MANDPEKQKESEETEGEVTTNDNGENKGYKRLGNPWSSGKYNDSILLASLFYIIIGLSFAWYKIEQSNLDVIAIFNKYQWTVIIAGTLILGIIGFLLYRISSSDRKKITLIIFIAIPILLILVAVMFRLRGTYQVVLLRSVFLMIACLLPATMYYLFIVSRKTSLLSEYYTNLSRMGLFEYQKIGEGTNPDNYESGLDRDMRIMSYLKKFEVVYGSISKKWMNYIIQESKPNNENDKLEKDKPHILPLSDIFEDSSLAGVFTPETAIPVVLATFLIGLGWLLTLPPWEMVAFGGSSTITNKLEIVLRPLQIPVHFAFLGAYFFSLQMLFRRYVRKDLQANAFMSVSIRIVLAVIGTWAVIQTIDVLNIPAEKYSVQGMLVIAFVIGAFPPIVWQVISAAFRIITLSRFIVPSLKTAMPVSDLDGLTVWHQVRLEEEDIENVPNMSTADMVDLMLNTRIPPTRIVDWVDQAMLFTALGPENKRDNANVNEDNSIPMTRRQRLRKHGIRTASALVAAHKKSEAHHDTDLFENILPSQDRSNIRGLVDTLSLNSNLNLIQKWRHQRGRDGPPHIDITDNLRENISGQETNEIA